jgi:dihydropyrimidine dehydrogenase (NAD+) subunit PreT
MSHIPSDRSESIFTDFKPPYDDDGAMTEANRCLYCHDAPCIRACPTEIDIPTFIRKISTGNPKGAARTILDANIFGTSCARVCPVEVLCVGACVYNNLHQPPIQIGKLQRWATDQAMAAQWRFFHAGPANGRSVGLIGGGPASLAAAHELRTLGYACTIYEKRPVIGGLNTTGVAPYKLRADDSVAEVQYVLGIGGIEVRTGVEVGTDVTLEAIEAAHDAVFVGVGLGADSAMRVPGEDLAGIHGAVEWIERMKLGKVDLSNVKVAAVVGGGNTAVDAVRELRWLGVPLVYLLYRGDEKGMSGYAHEWHAGRVESVRAMWHVVPAAYEGDGQVKTVVLQHLDEHKRPIVGKLSRFDADLVLLAIGQGKLGTMFGNLPGITLEKGRVVTDAVGFTGRPKWWAGGDAANGGKEVVNAVAEGRDAARAMHKSLMGATDV